MALDLTKIEDVMKAIHVDKIEYVPPTKGGYSGDAHAYDPVVFAAWAKSMGFSTAHWAFDPARP